MQVSEKGGVCLTINTMVQISIADVVCKLIFTSFSVPLRYKDSPDDKVRIGKNFLVLYMGG